jgi:fermentation-respiration switch protein FrsA (DUF1100 family)
MMLLRVVSPENPLHIQWPPNIVVHYLAPVLLPRYLQLLCGPWFSLFGEKTFDFNRIQMTYSSVALSSFKWIGYILITVVIASLVLIYTNQTFIIYPSQFPEGSRTTVPNPKEFGLDYEDLTILSKDQTKLHCYFIKGRTPKTILYLHANAGNMGHRIPIAKEFVNRFGYSVFMLSYRGYGKSEGYANEQGLREDGQAALDYLVDKGIKEIIVFGQSIGGAVAIDLASKNESKVKGLIIENTFTSLRNVIPKLMPFMKHFTFLCTQIWPSEERIKTIKLPVLFLSSQKDEIVPKEHMATLAAVCKSKVKIFKPFINGTHNDTCMQLGYFEAIKDFLEKAKKGTPRSLKD